MKTFKAVILFALVSSLLAACGNQLVQFLPDGGLENVGAANPDGGTP